MKKFVYEDCISYCIVFHLKNAKVAKNYSQKKLPVCIHFTKTQALKDSDYIDYIGSIGS